MNALNFEHFQTLSKAQVEAATALAATVTKGMQELAVESAEYSKQSMTAGAQAVERLIGAKSVETALQIQAEYAKLAYEGFVARSTRVNEIFARIAGEAIKPAQSAFSAAVAKA